MAGIFDITLTDPEGNVLPARALALVRPDGTPVPLFASLTATEPLASNVVTTDPRGQALAFCSGTVEVRDAITGAVLRSAVEVLPYTAPEAMPVSVEQAKALKKVVGLPPGGLRSVIFASSTGQRVHCVLGADVVISNGVATFTTGLNHMAHTGHRVSVGLKNPTTAAEEWRVTGPITRTGTRTFTMPAPGRPNATFSTDVRFLGFHAAPSWWRACNQALGGALRLVANFAMGGENTARKLQYYQEIDALAPELVIGEWGLGNDVLGNDTAGSEARMKEMIRHFTAQGIWVLVILPPAVPTLTPTQMSNALPVNRWLFEERMRNARLLLVDEFPLTVNPATGMGDPKWFADPTNVHSNHCASRKKGEACANALRPLLGGGLPDWRAASVHDRLSASATSRQLVQGFWTTDGLVAPASTGNKATGLVDPGIGFIGTTGSAGRSMVCSLVPRADGRGYVQRMVITGAAGDGWQVQYEGFGSWQLKTLLQARLADGLPFEAAAGLRVEQSAPGVLGGYEHFIEATVDGVAARLTAHIAQDQNVAEPAPFELVLDDQPALFEPFVLPPGAACTQASFTIKLQLAAAGTVTLEWSLLTLRQLPPPVLNVV
ncbi:hypothetical protein [Ideonella paludis]|nr:hypothetical protein [Ideonella paludis]